MTQGNKKEPPHYVGHRKRLKDKFLKADPATFSDYELLELLLFQSTPRKDVKPLAKNMLQEFGDFNQLINAERKKILAVDEATESSFLQLRIIKELINRVLQDNVRNTNIISSWSALLEYLKFNMGCLKLEQFRVLFLNKKNMLLADEVMATGTIDQTPVYPREIVKKALFHEAGAIILVHNHPSGNSNPSNSDIDLTTQIVNACNTINVSVHDHVIIGAGEYYSFKSNMLL
ncbi:MAG: DNA repair protein RadC [Rickettsiaceae bacterium]|nr:DNA repair protein RadC [Rickettsiaceae bacterium]MDP4832352.1 DNA repair protein RadC [Rickettsiaceae bacterium]MDP5020170.1 DNA repair protein RadC [Rickettsiaceae bacterium]MDP5082934.1 DNA repair protein RadC [Rickettsiaceae bacterium]